MSDSPPSDPVPDPAPDSSKPGEAPAAPAISTPVVLAVLSLSGVLGTSLLSNWDKIFGKSEAKPAPAVAATAPAVPAALVHGGTQSPVLSGVSGPVTINYGQTPPSGPAPDALATRLQGVWLSDHSTHPYQPDRRFRLRLELHQFGGQLTGQLSDIPEGRESGPVIELPALKPGAEGLDFETQGRWCCEDGKERSYQTFYQLRFEPQGLALTRRNNAPGGGKVERFLLSKS